MTDNNEMLLGIKQVLMPEFKAAEALDMLNGYMWFVRDNNISTHNYIYLGSRLYGEAEIEVPLSGLVTDVFNNDNSIAVNKTCDSKGITVELRMNIAPQGGVVLTENGIEINPEMFASHKEMEDLKVELANVNASLSESIGTLNENVAASVEALNQNMVNGFNTINGGIDNEIRPAIKSLEESIAEEENRAESAEENLLTAINTETERAKLSEKDLKDAIEVLNGTGEGSVSKAVADGIASVVAGAPESFDTLKEIADYIASDTTSAAKMVADIEANANAIAAEKERSIKEDETLRLLIDAVNNNVNDKADKLTETLNAEVIRSTGKDTEIETKLDAEIERAKSSEMEITNNVSNFMGLVDTDVNKLHGIIEAEKERAMAEESSIKESVASETERAMAAENANSDAIAVLTGTGEGSVSKTVSDEIAKVVADAPEAFDTLKEIADYIASDTTHAAKMVADIEANAKAIADEKSRAEAKEGELQSLIIRETSRALGAEAEKLDKIVFDEAMADLDTALAIMQDSINSLADKLVEAENRIKVLEGRIYSSDVLVEMISSIKEGETLELMLMDDVAISEGTKFTIPQGATLNINLNGNTLNSTSNDIVFRVNGTLNIGGGNVNSDFYAASANEGGAVNVSDGNFRCNVTCFQSNGGIVNIYDGYYNAYNETYGSKYTLNYIDAMKEIGKINVMGGTFVGFDPSMSKSENPEMNFLAEGYISVASTVDGVEVYTVEKGSQAASSEELSEIINNATEGETVKVQLSEGVTLDGSSTYQVKEGVTVDLDMAGNALVNPVSGSASFENLGNLTLRNAKIVNGNTSEQGCCALINKGTLTIEGGEIGSKESRGAAIENHGTLNINGGTYSTLEKDNTNDAYAYVFINYAGTMNVNDAYSDGNPHGMFAAIGGTINVNGGKFEMGGEGKTTFYMAYVTNGTINFNGGEFVWGKGAAAQPTYVGGSGSINFAEGVEIKIK